MRAVIQRVKKAHVSVNEKIIGSIGHGLVVLLGIGKDDTQKDKDWIVEKVTKLRIFEGKTGKMDFSVQDANGELLIISQFTLYGKCDKGRRPDFTEAAPVAEAKELYHETIKAFEKTGIPVQQGEFQAYMQVELQNDGPVTLILESPQKK
ncbi:D-tyrosyl-tRNA(Tyr) deacylase [Candidatus Peregrinibacteria bacterium]|nr:D-tyrosyl-tRNA(Tyr) deacylase [Candidatus Peregrinibacteria bacterium]